MTTSTAGKTSQVQGHRSQVAMQLEAAARLLEKGWTQGVYEDCGAFCLSGAIYEVVGRGGDVVPAREYVKKAIGIISLVGWNDEPGRTQAEVVSAVRKAAELARATGLECSAGSSDNATAK